MDWFEQAKKLKAEGKNMAEISRILNKPYKTIESRFYREKLRGDKTIIKAEYNLQDSILKELSKGCAINYLMDKYKASERVIRATIEDIQDQGYDVDIINNTVQLRKVAQEENKTHSIGLKDGWHKAGVVSDTHLNSKYQQLTHLKKTYEIFAQERVEFVLHAGDITAGKGMYKGQEYEVINLGADEQCDYIVQNYPHIPGVKTKLIAGNHDLSYYNSMGYDICKQIANRRDDIEYLGQLGAYVEISEGVYIYLLHPDSGQAYAVSYKPQKIAAGFVGGQKPNIMIIGHYHQAEYLFERNIHIIQAGCFETQTPYLKRKGIMPKVAGWMIEFKVDGGSVTRFKQELITYYKSIEHDY
jgi:predicted phosphodiesterase